MAPLGRAGDLGAGAQAAAAGDDAARRPRPEDGVDEAGASGSGRDAARVAARDIEIRPLWLRFRLQSTESL